MINVVNDVGPINKIFQTTTAKRFPKKFCNVWKNNRRGQWPVRWIFGRCYRKGIFPAILLSQVQALHNTAAVPLNSMLNLFGCLDECCIGLLSVDNSVILQRYIMCIVIIILPNHRRNNKNEYEMIGYAKMSTSLVTWYFMRWVQKA